jgi:8-amino-7-oxononanoate synthase
MADMPAMREWLTAAASRRARCGGVRTADARRNPLSHGRLLDLASNDYLGLSGHPRLRAAAREAITRLGAGAGASRVVTGTTTAHLDIERELADLTGQPSCLAFSSGYTANMGILTALGDPGTLLISDAHVHASLIDGARLSRSPVRICPHADLDALAGLLRERREQRAVVVIESIYSVLGDAADVTATARLCADHDARSRSTRSPRPRAAHRRRGARHRRRRGGARRGARGRPGRRRARRRDRDPVQGARRPGRRRARISPAA